MKILVIDIGGSKVKLLVSGETEPRKAKSGPGLTPARLVEIVKELTTGWDYDAISIGYPGQVRESGPESEPGNLGPGWVGFNYAAAFDHPVKIINDAAMQALGSYHRGRMLFLGLGTGLGSALIADRTIIALELGRLPFGPRSTLGQALGRSGLKRMGKRVWRRAVRRTIVELQEAFLVEDMVVGGGNAELLKRLPPGARLGHNLTAFRGGFRLWGLEQVPIQGSDHVDPPEPPSQAEWRVI